MVRRAFRTAAPAGTFVGAAGHSSSTSRRFQDVKQKPFSELDRGRSGTLHDRSRWRTPGHVTSAGFSISLELVPGFGGKMRNAGRIKLGYYPLPVEEAR